MAVKIDPTTLRELVAALYEAAGLPGPDAALVADTLVRADLQGHGSHGVMRAPWYLDRVRHGVMEPVTRAETVVDAGAVAVVDGHEGVGQVIARDAMLDAVARAKRHGVGVVSVRNSNHHCSLGRRAFFSIKRGKFSNPVNSILPPCNPIAAAAGGSFSVSSTAKSMALAARRMAWMRSKGDGSPPC